MTFSIVGADPKAGMVGIAICSAAPAAGAFAPYVQAQVGAVTTQAFINPYLGPDSLAMLTQGKRVEDILDTLLSADPGKTSRQMGIVDPQGRSAAFTGEDCAPWAGHATGQNYSAQGNILVDETTVAAMADAFVKHEDKPLPERLLLALEAGDQTGGDSRGRQSAGLKVYSTEAYPYCDLRVDEHHAPVPELRRVFEVYQREMLPYITQLSTREHPLGIVRANAEERIGELLRRVEERPD